MAAFGQQLPVCSLSPENLCGHSLQASSWKGKEGCIILRKAYRWHLPRSTHFPSLPPPASSTYPPSSFTLSGGFSIVWAFFLSPLFLAKTGLSLWVEKGSVFMARSCISKVLCWCVMNLPLLMWGNREILGPFSPQTEIDVISLPVVPKEMFCSISSPFRLSPIYVQSWGTAIKHHCRYHQRLRPNSAAVVSCLPSPRFISLTTCSCLDQLS